MILHISQDLNLINNEFDSGAKENSRMHGLFHLGTYYLPILYITMPESSGHGNFVDFWLATLPMALSPKNFFAFLTKLGNSKQKFFGGNAIGNVAKQKSALSRADDSGQS